MIAGLARSGQIIINGLADSLPNRLELRLSQVPPLGPRKDLANHHWQAGIQGGLALHDLRHEISGTCAARMYGPGSHRLSTLPVVAACYVP